MRASLALSLTPRELGLAEEFPPEIQLTELPLVIVDVDVTGSDPNAPPTDFARHAAWVEERAARGKALDARDEALEARDQAYKKRYEYLNAHQPIPKDFVIPEVPEVPPEPEPPRYRAKLTGLTLSKVLSGRLTETVSWRYDPGPLPLVAQERLGYREGQFDGLPSFESTAGEVADFLRGAVPLAYGAQVDRAFLHAEARRCPLFFREEGDPLRDFSVLRNDLALPPALRPATTWVDVLVWARSLQPRTRGFSLLEALSREGGQLPSSSSPASWTEAIWELFQELLARAKRPTHTYQELITSQRVLFSGG